MPEKALTSFTVCDAYHYFAIQTVITSQVVHAQYRPI